MFDIDMHCVSADIPIKHSVGGNSDLPALALEVRDLIHMQQLWWTNVSESQLRKLRSDMDGNIKQAVAEYMVDASKEIEEKKDNVLSALSAILYDLEKRVRDEMESFTQGLSTQHVQVTETRTAIDTLSEHADVARRQQEQKIADLEDSIRSLREEFVPVITSLNDRIAGLQRSPMPTFAEHSCSKVRASSVGRGLPCTVAGIAEHFQETVADLKQHCSLIGQEVRSLSSSLRASQIISNAVKGRIEQSTTLEEQLIDEISEFRSSCVSLAAVVNSRMDEQDSHMTEFRDLADVVTRERAERVEQLTAMQSRVASLQSSEQEARAEELATHSQRSARELEDEREARRTELAALRLELSRQFSAVVNDICAAKAGACRAPGSSTPSTQSEPSPPSTGSSDEASGDTAEQLRGRRGPGIIGRAQQSRRGKSGERQRGRSLPRQ